MNDIQIFPSEEFGNIRTVTIKGTEYFFGVDVATALQYKRPRRAITDNCKGVITDATLKNAGNYPEPLVPIGDIYRLIVKASSQSNSEEIKEKAERFEKLVFDKILPQIHKTGAYGTPQLIMSTDEKIQLLAQGNIELNEKIEKVDSRVDDVKAELEAFKLDLPILPIEADKITCAVKKKGVELLGGKLSNAYNNRNLRQRVYNDIYANLKYNFGIRSYKSLKRNQTETAIEIIKNYKPPYFLSEEISNCNAQQTLSLNKGE